MVPCVILIEDIDKLKPLFDKLIVIIILVFFKKRYFHSSSLPWRDAVTQ